MIVVIVGAMFLAQWVQVAVWHAEGQSSKNVLEIYYTCYNTVKTPQQVSFLVDLGCFFEFKKFTFSVAHVNRL